MIEGARVFVIVPAFREARRIGSVLRTMPASVDRVIVVDDGSDDATADVARTCGDERLTVIRHERNRGVGAAIATGYRVALEQPGGPRDAFVVMAGDGQMDPDDLPALVGPVARGEAGYAKGTRVGDSAHIPVARYLGGRVMTALTCMALGLGVTDSQCGYTAISRQACATLDLGAVWHGFGYPNDLLAKLSASGVSLAEVPVQAVYTARRNKLRAWHVPVIAFVIARSLAKRLRATTW